MTTPLENQTDPFDIYIVAFVAFVVATGLAVAPWAMVLVYRETQVRSIRARCRGRWGRLRRARCRSRIARWSRHADRWWGVYSLLMVAAIMGIILGAAKLAHGADDDADPCEPVAVLPGGAGQWNADGVLVGVIVNVEAVGEVAPWVSVQAINTSAIPQSVYYEVFKGEVGKTLQVRAAPNVEANVLYVTSGWPGGEQCRLQFLRADAPPPPVVEPTPEPEPADENPATVEEYTDSDGARVTRREHETSPNDLSEGF